jgi:hypothetical protein
MRPAPCATRIASNELRGGRFGRRGPRARQLFPHGLPPCTRRPARSPKRSAPLPLFAMAVRSFGPSPRAERLCPSTSAFFALRPRSLGFGLLKGSVAVTSLRSPIGLPGSGPNELGTSDFTEQPYRSQGSRCRVQAPDSFNSCTRCRRAATLRASGVYDTCPTLGRHKSGSGHAARSSEG